ADVVDSTNLNATDQHIGSIDSPKYNPITSNTNQEQHKSTNLIPTSDTKNISVAERDERVEPIVVLNLPRQIGSDERVHDRLCNGLPNGENNSAGVELPAHTDDDATVGLQRVAGNSDDRNPNNDAIAGRRDEVTFGSDSGGVDRRS